MPGDENLRNFTESVEFTPALMNPEENDDLWQLLGKATKPSVSPFFSRDTLRKLREEQENPGLFRRFQFRWALGAVGACAAVALFMRGPGEVETFESSDPVALLASAVVASPDYQVIRNLDELLDSEESSVWLDSNTF